MVTSHRCRRGVTERDEECGASPEQEPAVNDSHQADVAAAQASADVAVAWADSGLLSLTGRPGGPGLGPPLALVQGVRAWADRLAGRSAALGTPVSVDPLALLAERAAVAGLTRGGDVSCGGGTRLLPASDGWVAASLTREDDWDLVAAWLGRPGPVGPGGWSSVAEAVADSGCAELQAGAALVGLPVSVLGERRRPAPDPPRGPAEGIHGISGWRIGSAPVIHSLDELVVVDLSSLWAGPLAGRLLLQAGARVVKVESTRRPDGPRRGSPRFFGRLNSGKQSVALDFTTTSGSRQLGELVARADVVITGSRPRALEQLGLALEDRVAEGRPRVWLSITGYGRSGPSGQRVAFGDDAAVAGGLVVRDDLGPCFCGDAIADPLCGLASAVAVLDALAAGGTWILDASMADIAGGLTGPGLPVVGLAAGPPPDPGDPSALELSDLGADTETVLASLSRA